jgi:CDP-glycerol glycerophosphotransferase
MVENKTMLKRFIILLRKVTIIHKICFWAATALLYFVSFFIRVDKKMILFNNIGEKICNGSPKVLYDKMAGDDRFKDCKFVWGVFNPEKHNIDGALKVKLQTLKYYYYALKSKCWIVDCDTKTLGFQRKRTFYLNTWHGAPIKKIGFETGKKLYGNPDIMCAQGDYDADILSRVFGIDKRKNVLLSGLPRNDALAACDESLRSEIKDKLNLPHDKKIILYCPTHRDSDNMQPPIDIVKWKNELSVNYVFIFRVHPSVSKTLNIEDDNFFRNFSEYESLNDLMIASDLLISDYSSVYFDYSILGKPMLCYAYDHETYMDGRGMYIDIKRELPCEISYGEDNLLEQLTNLDYDRMSKETLKFRDKYVKEFGNATNICVDKIWEYIK